MPLTVEQFSQRLTSSGVMSEDELRDWVAAVPVENRPGDGEALARELVKQKKLTKFQAEQIYAGKEKSLTLGNYLLLDKLGQGGMGMVLKARHRRMGRVVALKVMFPAAVKSADAVKRFHREVQTAAKLTHPNIVTAFDADEAKGTHFLVMEYVEGNDLSQLVKAHGVMSVEQAIECILQAARGLAHAHKEGVVHRDIKPANLLLDKNGTVKILDMGLARLDSGLSNSADVSSAGLTQSGTIMGTVDYMSPEQAEDTRHADARSDIYSLGCSLFYLLTGRVVFGGETMMKKLLAHRDAQIPSLAVEARRVGRVIETHHESTSATDAGGSRGLDPPYEALDSVFRKMVAKKPSDRQQSMLEVITDLERCRSGEGVTVNVTTASEAGSSNELQQFLRQISGEEASQVTSAGTIGTSTTPKDATSETMLFTDGKAGTDPQTEMTLSRMGTPARRASVERGTGRSAHPTRRVFAIGLAVVVLLLGGVWLFRTPRGVMQIEITDEEAEVTLGETGRVLRGKTNGMVKLPVGEHVLHVQVGETTLDTPEITIAKNEPIEIKVERVGNRVRVMRDGEFFVAKELPRSKSSATSATTSPTQAAPIVTKDSEREVAEWVFNNGGDVVVLSPYGKVSKLADLPKEPFSISGVTLRKMPNLTVANVDRLATLRELKELDISETTLSVEVARRIAERVPVETLRHTVSATSSAAMHEFLKLRTLRKFQATGGVDVDDEFLANVAQLQRLTNLQLGGCKSVTEEGFVRLSANPPPKLNYFALGGMNVFTVKAMRAIAQLPHLGYLKVSQTTLDDAGLIELERCPALSLLYLSLTDVTGLRTTGLQKALTGCQIRVSKPEQATPLYDQTYRDTVRQLMNRGYSVLLATNLPGGEAWLKDQQAFPPGEVVFASAVSTYDRQFATSAEDIKLFAKLRDLPSLTVVELPTDGLRELLPLQNLSLLYVGRPLTDEDVASLVSFKKLNTLVVGISRDTALDSIARLPHLSVLTLRLAADAQVKSLKPLESVAPLSELNFLIGGGKHLTETDAQAFAKARPDVIVTWLGKRLDQVANVTQARPGNFALEFAGGENQVVIDGLSAPQADAFTWEGWVTPKTNGNFSLMSVPVADGQGLFRVAFVNGGPDAVRVHGQKQAIGATAGKSLPDSGPFHLAVTYSKETWTLWVNGKQVGKGANRYAWNNAVKKTFAAKMGVDWGVPINEQHKREPFQGTLDEVRISKLARYSSEFTPNRRFEPDKDTLALYHCDEGSGEVLKDSSGNNHHGKINGAKWVNVGSTGAADGATFTNSLGMEFVRVPKGRSWLGGGGGKAGLQEVDIKEDFYLGKYEVTQEEWQRVMGKNPSSFSRNGLARNQVAEVSDADLKRFPVETISWNDASEFVRLLNEQTREPGWEYRLPTDEQWEYAARNGPLQAKSDDKFDYYFDKPTNTVTPKLANYQRDDGPKRAVRVGSFSANRLGLHDMHGNVWEWCAGTAPPDPKSTDGSPQHILRGGSWSSNAINPCRAAERAMTNSSKLTSGNGLRVARVRAAS